MPTSSTCSKWPRKKDSCLQQCKVCHKTGLSDILWWCLLSPGILSRSGKDPRHHRDDSPSNQTGATVIFRSGQLSSDICSSSVTTLLLKKDNIFAWDENSNTHASGKSSPFFRKHSWNHSSTMTGPSQWLFSVTLHSRDWEPASCLCEQVPHRHQKMLCQHWEGAPGHHIWLWEVLYIPVW